LIEYIGQPASVSELFRALTAAFRDMVLFYGIIAIHDIPHMIAESRHHPHQAKLAKSGWGQRSPMQDRRPGCAP
jgi:hypothetical protein